MRTRGRQPAIPGTLTLRLQFMCGMELCFPEVLDMEIAMAAWDSEEQKQALFAQWALPHQDSVYTACLYLTRQRDAAEDLFQETYLRAFRFFHQFTPGTNCRAWLLTIMQNGFKNHYARSKRMRQTVNFDTAAYEYDQKRIEAGEAGRDNPADLLLSQFMDGEITRMMYALPEEYRSALVLVDIEELTYDEAAGVLNCPIGTVRSRLARARRQLREALATYARHNGYLRRAKPLTTAAEPIPQVETKV